MTNPSPETCSVCSGSKFSVLVTIESYTLWTCLKCQLWILLPRKSSHQDNDYKSVLDLDIYINYNRPFRAGQYRRELKDIALLSPGKTLLDIGCATGWFLKEANELGYTTNGLEPQKSLAKIAARDNPESHIIHKDVTQIKNLDEKYDVISLWSVLEHLKDPKSTLIDLKNKLSPHGVLAIRTPNSQGLLQQLSIRLYKLSAGRFKLPVRVILQLEFSSKHWFIFSQQNLTRLLANSGFTVVRSRQSTSMNWRRLGDWYKARKLSPGTATLWLLILAFAGNSFLSHLFNRQDDLIVFAVKGSSK